MDLQLGHPASVDQHSTERLVGLDVLWVDSEHALVGTTRLGAEPLAERPPRQCEPTGDVVGAELLRAFLVVVQGGALLLDAQDAGHWPVMMPAPTSTWTAVSVRDRIRPEILPPPFNSTSSALASAGRRAEHDGHDERSAHVGLYSFDATPTRLANQGRPNASQASTIPRSRVPRLPPAPPRS